jgi:hypothetical protein
MRTSIEKCLYGIQCYKNVSQYKPLEGPEFAWEITYEKEALPESTELPIYFIVDSMNHAAFSHWVYESSTWLPFFLNIQSQFPTCRLVFEESKRFKHLYLDYSGISSDRFCLRKDMQAENYCFFHTYTSLNDTSIPSIYYKNLLDYKASFDRCQTEKSIPLLYLPRGTKENLHGTNNRVYGIQNDLKDFVRQLGGTVYETDETTHLHEQILLVKQAKVILLDYGSNLWVNGLFATNSKLICLNIGWKQHPIYPSFGFVWKEIHKTNTVEEIFAYPSDEKTEDGIAIVQFHSAEVIQKILSSL